MIYKIKYIAKLKIVKAGIVISILFFLSNAIIYAECITTGERTYLLKYLMDNKERLFYVSEHRYSPKDQMYLIIDISGNDGMLFEKQECTIIHGSSIKYSNKDNMFIIDETHGGVESRHKAQDILDTMIKGKFEVLSGKNIFKLLGLDKE